MTGCFAQDLSQEHPAGDVICKETLCEHFANTLFQSTIRKTLRAGIDDQKGRLVAEAIAREADFACFQAQKPLNSNVREAGEAELDEVNYRTICINLKY